MISITTNLLTNNPAYNNSIIKYSSNLGVMTSSTIQIDGENFKIYPFNNVFSFNFLEIIKIKINTNNFKDLITPNLDNKIMYDDTTLSKVITATITTTNGVVTDSLTVSYNFYKGVEQLIGYTNKLIINDVIKLSIPSVNYFTYPVTYFEGYPFDFSIIGLTSTDVFKFKNNNTGILSPSFSGTTQKVKRFFLSDGAINETLNGVLPLTTNTNDIGLYVNNILIKHISINKIDSKSGVYLKWFNKSGGYSYWLFDNIYNETTSTSGLDDFSGGYDNLQNLTTYSESLGKLSSKKYELVTKYDEKEKEYLLDILDSPKVEMYIYQQPFNKIDDKSFIGVYVKVGSFNNNNKSSKNSLMITIELPKTNTITY